MNSQQELALLDNILSFYIENNQIKDRAGFDTDIRAFMVEMTIRQSISDSVDISTVSLLPIDPRVVDVIRFRIRENYKNLAYE